MRIGAFTSRSDEPYAAKANSVVGVYGSESSTIRLDREGFYSDRLARGEIWNQPRPRGRKHSGDRPRDRRRIAHVTAQGIAHGIAHAIIFPSKARSSRPSASIYGSSTHPSVRPGKAANESGSERERLANEKRRREREPTTNENRRRAAASRNEASGLDRTPRDERRGTTGEGRAMSEATDATDAEPLPMERRWEADGAKCSHRQKIDSSRCDFEKSVRLCAHELVRLAGPPMRRCDFE